jgi:formylmethanofuran dehydrogenase subunit E
MAMRKLIHAGWLLLGLSLAGSALAHDVSVENWIATGERVHGGYGSLIALGVRIGLDAREKLSAQPRDLDVTYYDGEKTPCACVVDGILIATSASPGQGSLRIAAERAPTGAFGVALIRHRKTGAALRYTVPFSASPKLGAINREEDAKGRHAAVMAEPSATWFAVERAAP